MPTALTRVLWDHPPRELARALFDESRDAILVIDPADRIVDANPAAVRLIGWPRLALIGSAAADCLTRPDHPQTASITDLVRTAREAVRFQLCTSTGGCISVGASCSELSGPTPLTLLVLRDLRALNEAETRAERAEEERQRFEDQYRNMVEGSLQGVMIHQDERIRYANPALARMFGYDGPDELVGRALWETFVLPEHLPVLRARTAAILSGEAIPPHPGWCAIGKDGRRLWVATTASRVEWYGRPAVVAFYLDISEQKRAEQALNESQALYSSLVGALPIYLFRKDRAGRFVFANRQFCELAGVPLDRLLGRTDADLWPENSAAAYRADDLRVMETGHPIEKEETNRRPDGTAVHVHVIKTPVLDAAGAVVGVQGVFWDITDRKRAEEERRKFDAQVQQAQKLESLGVLAGGVAHDFNNLLTSVLGYSNLAALDLPAGSPTRALIGEIEKAAQRAAELTRQMLAYSGRGKFVVQTVRLDELVGEMSSLLRTVVSKKAVFHLELGPATFDADATQIRQVVMNLITNASDALDGRPGAIALRTGTRDLGAEALRSPFVQTDPPAGPYAYLEVEDSGCGMSEETLARIFDPFFTTKFTGRGLGLAAVLGIIRGHKGSLQIASAPGEGTTFRVFFPAKPAPPDAPAVVSHAVRPRGEGTILVADDEENVRGFVRAVLEGAGYRVLLAPDGVEAVRLARAHDTPIRAAVLDLTMPGMSGWEAAAEIRAARPHLPVILMSGYNDPDGTDRTGSLTLAAFLPKPFRPGDLLERVDRAARLSPA